MTQPKHDPDRVLNLRVTPELKARLAALLEHVPTGAAKLSRHGLAVWCLERGLMEAEAAPAAVLASPSARPAIPSPASVTAPRAPRTPRKTVQNRPEPTAQAAGDASVAALRQRLHAARAQGVQWAELSRRSGVVPSGLRRFAEGINATIKGDGLERVAQALGELGVP